MQLWEEITANGQILHNQYKISTGSVKQQTQQIFLTLAHKHSKTVTTTYQRDHVSRRPSALLSSMCPDVKSIGLLIPSYFTESVARKRPQTDTGWRKFKGVT